MNNDFINSLEEYYLPNGAKVKFNEIEGVMQPAIVYSRFNSRDGNCIIVGYTMENNDHVAVFKRYGQAYRLIGSITGGGKELKQILASKTARLEDRNLMITWKISDDMALLQEYSVEPEGLRLITDSKYRVSNNTKKEDDSTDNEESIINFSTDEGKGFKYTYKTSTKNRNLIKDTVTIDSIRGKIISDKYYTKISLIGKKVSDGGFYEDIRLIYKPNERSMNYEVIKPSIDTGYNPTIDLFNFMDNGLEQVLLVMDNGGSGGYITSYIYSLKDSVEDVLFDSEVFNGAFLFDVNYHDHYIVKVTGGTPKREYIIDIRNKSREYLDQIYNKDGTLKEEMVGGVLGLGAIYPIDIYRNRIFEIQCMQRVIGINNGDNLGVMMTIFNFEENEFKFSIQSLGIEDYSVR